MSNGHIVIVNSEPDKGLYDAMNKGLALATGQYVCFMNAGDFYPNNSVLSDISKSLEENDEKHLPAVIYGDTDIEIISDIGIFLFRKCCHGDRSCMVCWCVIKLSMPEQILPKTLNTTYAIDIRLI